MRPGERLKELRGRLGITTREVAEESQKIADSERNAEYSVSNAWLTQLENTESVPSVYKLFSLSAIYRIKFSDLLKMFDVDLERINRYQVKTPSKKTYLAALDNSDMDRTVTFPVRFDHGFNVEKTGLISRLVEVWGEVPVAVIQHLDLRHSHYGYIGMEDFTMYPLLRPGSFVQIDPQVRKIQPHRWRTEFDRPIYFLEFRDGYGCGWCEMHGNQLLLLAHPLSPCTVKHYEYPREAEVVGQVTGVAMRIVDQGAETDGATARLPRRS